MIKTKPMIERGSFSVARFSAMQKRLHKYRRDPEALERFSNKRITPISLSIISNLTYYKILPTSLMVHLIVEPNPRTVQTHLQTLFQRGLINRFTFPRIGNPGEFHYYLDSTKALDLLVQNEWAGKSQLNYEEVQRNRDKAYSDIHDPTKVDEMQGRLMFLQHEAMISRFQAMLELGCRKSDGKVELVDFDRGARLWNSVKTPKLAYDPQRGKLLESTDTEQLPHRPDAFFTLRFPKREGERESHFFYEADRHTTTDLKRIRRKYRSHFHFVVKQRKHESQYDIKRIRAVLTETINPHWAERLREIAGHPAVSGNQPSPLFWFTTSTLYTGPGEPAKKQLYLAKPEQIFRKIWATPLDDQLLSLLE